MQKGVVYWVETRATEKDAKMGKIEYVLRFSLDRLSGEVGRIEIGIWPRMYRDLYYAIEYYAGEVMLFVNRSCMTNTLIRKRVNSQPWCFKFDKLDESIVSKGVKETIRSIFHALSAL